MQAAAKNNEPNIVFKAISNGYRNINKQQPTEQIIAHPCLPNLHASII